MEIAFDDIVLRGNLSVPPAAQGLVTFAHGSGSGRLSPRNQFVSQKFNEARLATLLFDLLTEEEEKIDIQTREFRFNIPLLAERLIQVTQYVQKFSKTRELKLGYFGASTGAAAALIAAAKYPEPIQAIVSRGGRPDLAGKSLKDVKAPTLLIVGGDDAPVIEMNKEALAALPCEKKLEIVPGATHLFEEPGKLEAVADLAKEWFLRYLV